MLDILPYLTLILFLEVYLPTRILRGFVKTCSEKTLSSKINILRLAIDWDKNKIQKWSEMYIFFTEKFFMA